MPRATTILTAAAVIWLVTPSPAPGQARTDPDLSGAVEAARDLDQLHSMLVSWRGELVLEHYAPKIARDRLANIKSASKSVISTLVGLALARGLLRGVDEPIATYLPQLARAPAEKRSITIEDLLTMRAGLESTSGRNYGAWVRSRNWVQYALERPLVSEPGTTMEYSTGTSHILSAIVTRASRTSTWQFAQQALAKPLGFSLAPWTRDPQGIYLGGNEMLMTPPQMLAFGELYLNRGRAKGRQVVPAGWVDESCRPRTRSAWDPTREYGYGWWIQDIGGYRACFAWGYGGQYIFTFRDLDLVVVITSSTASSEERRGYRRRLVGLLREHILEPIAEAASHDTIVACPRESRRIDHERGGLNRQRMTAPASPARPSCA
jgi:CubicO group peptidase (beta-lactamase class C family)